MKPKREKVAGKGRGRLSDARTLSRRQRMEKVLLAPPFLPAGHPTWHLSPYNSGECICSPVNP